MKTLITLFTAILFALSVTSQAQVTSYPYVNTGNNLSGWSVNQTGNLWYLSFVNSDPSGNTNNLAIVCNNYNFPNITGTTGMIISPVFDFTNLTKPVLNFYTAYKTHTAQNDSLIVLISTDGGATYGNAPVPYKRSFNSTPSLATLPPNTNVFVPSSPSQWRYESIDLTAYAGMNNVKVAFKGYNANGNNCWIDDFVISEANQYCSQTVTNAGTYNCNSLVEISMNTVGLAPVNIQTDNSFFSSDRVNLNQDNIILLPNGPANEKGIIIENGYEQNDNPSGGVLSVSERDNQTPISQSSPVINVNTTATNPGGTITNPNVIYQDYWFVTTYTGNDYLGYANYNISIDVTYFTNRTKLYIVKRADLAGAWTCLNTTVNGDFVVASGLNIFGDFALAGDSVSQPLPVELSSFVSVINNNNVTLNWSTASELNNSGFDVERADLNNAGNWSKIANVSGKGTSENVNFYSFTDKNVNSGKYNYRLKQIDYNGNYEYFNLSNEVNIGVPVNYNLSQNYPNPFNPTTKINYELAFDSKVSLTVFDVSGKEVGSLVNATQPAGYYSVNFNGSSLSSGMYFYKISVDGNGNNFSAVKKMILVK